MTMKPLTDNMLNAIQIIAAHITMGRGVVSIRDAVDGGAWNALYRRDLLVANEQGRVEGPNVLTDEAWALVDQARMFEVIDAEIRRLTIKQNQLVGRLRAVTGLLTAAEAVTHNSGMVKITGRVWFEGGQRERKVSFIVAEDATYEVIAARMEAQAREADWRGTFGAVTATHIDSNAPFGTVGD